MKNGLNLDAMPVYNTSAFKHFLPGEKHITRTFPEDVLIVMLDGELHFNEDSRPITVTGGQFYIQQRGLLQEGIIPSSTAKYYYIHFMGSYTTGRHVLPIAGPADLAKLSPLLSRLERLHLNSASSVEKNAVFYEILILLNESFSNTPSNRLVSKVISILSEDLKRTYSLDELSQLCNYSKNHIINVFKKEIGCTPYAYTIALRINAAKKLLATSDMSIADISEECGFQNYVNMYREFMKHSGCSPTDWRKKKRNL